MGVSEQRIGAFLARKQPEKQFVQYRAAVFAVTWKKGHAALIIQPNIWKQSWIKAFHG